MNSYKQSFYSSLIRICANLIMVAAIFFAMYQARRWPGWSSETVFCLFFFGITIPVWLLAWQLVKLVRRKWPAEFQSLVSIPGRGPRLVRWRVREAGESFFLMESDSESR